MVNESDLLNLTTQQLLYLVALDRSAAVQDAAADLGVSPSALSQGLSELERRIGVELFERRGRSRSLTDQGRELVPLAERVLGATQDLTRWARRTAAGDIGRVRIGMIDIAATVHFPDALAGFRQERPDVDLHLTVASSSMLLDAVAAGRLDAAVAVGPQETDRLDPLPGWSNLRAERLLAEELAVYAPPAGSPAGPDLGAPSSAEPNVLDRTRRRAPSTWGPWVTFPPSSTTRAQIAGALRQAGARFTVAAESHQPEVLRQLVNLGMGWTVLPRPQAEREPFPLRPVRPAPLLVRHLVVARRVDAPLHPAADHLLERLRANAANS